VRDDSGLNFLRAAHSAVSEHVKPVYTIREFQPSSRTLALGRGSCSQRLACLEALARLRGIGTRVRALWLAGTFWNRRFPLTRSFIRAYVGQNISAVMWRRSSCGHGHGEPPITGVGTCSQPHNGLTQMGCLRHRFTERIFVRSKILDPSRSISSADCRPAASPTCCTARKRIRAIEICISCRFRSLIQPTSDDRRSTSKRIGQARPSRYTATAARISDYRVRPTTR
jgi:hypothetical protein